MQLVPLTFMGILIDKWPSFITPNNRYGKNGGFNWATFASFEFTVNLVCLVCCFIVAIIDFVADDKRRKLQALIVYN